MPTDPGVVSDNDRLRRIDVRELQDDGAAAEHELGLGKLRPADVHLLANLRVFPDLDDIARQVAERPDARMPSDPDRLALDDGEKSDLDVIAEIDVLSDHDAAEADTHAPSNAVTEEQS